MLTLTPVFHVQNFYVQRESKVFAKDTDFNNFLSAVHEAFSTNEQ